MGVETESMSVGSSEKCREMCTELNEEKGGKKEKEKERKRRVQVPRRVPLSQRKNDSGYIFCFSTP